MISTALPSRPFELIRDQIVQILNLELPNQNTLQPNKGLNASIFKERFVPFQSSELPAVNVSLAAGDYGLVAAINQDGNFMYHIDAYHSANYEDGKRGDTEASVKLQKLAGVIQGILMHQDYITLGFVAPYIAHRNISDIKFAEPNNTKDMESVVMARITLVVRANSNSPLMTPQLIAGFDTVAMMSGTVQGYIYSGQ